MNYKAHDLAKLLLSLPNNYVMFNDSDENCFPDFEVVDTTNVDDKVNYIDSNDLNNELYKLMKDEDGDNLVTSIILFKPI